MRGFVANTDYDWFAYLRSLEPPIDEVNFWKPGSKAGFRRLDPGEPILFRLKAPRRAIVGFGYFTRFLRLPISVAWDAYRAGNGAATYIEMRERLLRIRARLNMETDPEQDFHIGCLLVNQPVFFREEDWIREPNDWNDFSPPGNTYDLSKDEGERIWLECLARGSSQGFGTIGDAPLPGGYGPPALVRQRLGQKSFRLVVFDAYGWRCAVTSERTVPALEAAHIRDYHEVWEHSVTNGITLRADIHKLFDRGYVTVTPDYHFEVSKRIKEEFENGRDYYALNGTAIRLPAKPPDKPSLEALRWHNENRYLG